MIDLIKGITKLLNKHNQIMPMLDNAKIILSKACSTENLQAPTTKDLTICKPLGNNNYPYE